jgi:hypothetical protein
MADSNPRRKRWWTVLGLWESTQEQFVEYVKAKTPLAAAILMRREYGPDDNDLDIKSVHPGRLKPCVPDEEWEVINSKLVCMNAGAVTDCEELYDDGGDGFDGYCPTCADRLDGLTPGARVRWTDPDPIEGQKTKDGVVVAGQRDDDVLSVRFDDGGEADCFRSELEALNG